jgi:hypothetical protein
MTECIPSASLPFHPALPVVVEFDAPEISSDGGALLLRQVDERLGLTAGFAACLPDLRDLRRVRHDRQEQARQRIFQIALGYADCNDADQLRLDPVLKLTCNRQPSESQGLSSQPSLSRFENAVDGKSLNTLIRFFEDSYVKSLPAETSLVILDIDATDDETHGDQQMSFFHGYYDHHMYHPLLVFDGDSGQLITTILRPGNTHASRGAVGVLRRLIRKIKRRLPQAQILVRGDGGFCVPRLVEVLEQLNAEVGDVDYLLGLAKNPVLVRRAASTMSWAAELFQRRGCRVQCFTQFVYAAASWSQPRRVIAKAEHSAWGANPRFVLTSLEGFPADLLYRAYCERGQCENLIKDFKNALQADRLSCSQFSANFFRLLLHTAAYRLLHALRQEVAAAGSAQLGHAQFDTLRLRLLKVAAWVTQSARRILVRLPKAFPYAELFSRLANSLASPQSVPT